jgi:hypothetical protein
VAELRLELLICSVIPASGLKISGSAIMCTLAGQETHARRVAGPKNLVLGSDSMPWAAYEQTVSGSD